MKIEFRVWSYYDKKYLPLEIKDSEIYVNAFGRIGYTKPTNDTPCLPQDELEIECFTGFYDKNGKEIYDGDILEMTYDLFPQKHKIVVGRGLDGAFWVGADIGIKHMQNPLYYHAKEEEGCKLKIIGNIHENPELLERVERENKLV